MFISSAIARVCSQSCACYYPNKVKEPQSYGPFSVELTALDTSNPDIHIRDFALTSKIKVCLLLAVACCRTYGL